jgi:acetylornithine deacetylase/succinyl-diaminopimelate desuccinylase-like protein
MRILRRAFRLCECNSTAVAKSGEDTLLTGYCDRYGKLEFTPINTYGILLEWKGKNESLKPYLFMAHQDVVPVLKVTESR